MERSPYPPDLNERTSKSTLKNNSMDRIVGDDIASGIRQVVHQLLTLASDPDSQQIMAKQPEFISGLVNYMSDDDEEVRLMAARALEFLSTNPANKSILVNHPGLVEKMKGMADSENEHARAISRRTLYNVKQYLNEEDAAFVQSHPSNTTEAVKQQETVVKTYTFTVENLDNSAISDSLQSSIIQTPGVTSVTLEKHKKRIIVTMRQVEGEDKEKELKDIIDRVLASHSVSAAAIEDNSGFVDDIFTNEEEGDQAVACYGFSSIESRLEQKKKEKEQKQKKEKKIGWLFGKVSNAMSKWW